MHLVSRGLSRLLLSLVCAVPAVSLASPAATLPAEGKAQVLLMGSFHFANPGRDTVKLEVADVRTPPHQAWLDALAQRIAAFAPTDVLVECPAVEADTWNAQLAAYRDGKGTLVVNEIAQIGMRLAKVVGVDRLDWPGFRGYPRMGSTPEVIHGNATFQCAVQA